MCNSADHLINCREFLEDNNHEDMNIFAKIETENGFKNINEIAKVANGIIIVVNKINELKDEKSLADTIERLKEIGIPVYVTYTKNLGKDYVLYQEKNVQELCKQ